MGLVLAVGTLGKAVAQSVTSPSIGAGPLFTIGTGGSLINTSTINATSGPSTVSITGAPAGSITNSGLIQFNGAAGGAAINVVSSGSVGTITNSGTISAAGAGSSAVVVYGSVASLTNSGLIAANDANGRAITIGTLGSIGSLVNSGTIQANGVGGHAIDNSGTIGSLVNSGVIQATDPTGYAIYNTGVIGALASSGSIGSVYNSGAISVGTGAPVITGNYTQAAAGQLGITVTDTTNGQLKVSGTATVGGTVAVNVATFNRNLINQTLTVVTAGTVVPVVPTVSVTSGLYDFTVTETATDLLLTGAPPSFANANAAASNLVQLGLAEAAGDGLTGLGYRNAVSIAQALQGLITNQILVGNDKLYDTLNNLTQHGWNQTYTQLVPSSVSRAQAMLTTSFVSQGPSSGVSNRLRLARDTNGTITGLAAGDDAGRGFSAWVEPFGGFASQDAQDGISGFNASIYGVSLGADTLIRPDVRVGLALDLGNTQISSNGILSGDSSSIFTTMLSGYGTWTLGPAFLEGSLSAGYSSYSGDNYISATASDLKSSFGGFEVIGRLGAGYNWTSGNLTLTPMVSLQQYHITTDSYTTSGGSAYGLDEHVGGTTVDITQPRIGSSLSYYLPLSTGQIAIPEVHLYYMHNFGTDHLTTTGNFIGGGSPFTTVTPTFASNIVDIGIGVNIVTKGPFSLSAAYDHTGSGSARQDTFFLQLKTEF